MGVIKSPNGYLTPAVETTGGGGGNNKAQRAYAARSTDGGLPKVRPSRVPREWSVRVRPIGLKACATPGAVEVAIGALACSIKFVATQLAIHQTVTHAWTRFRIFPAFAGREISYGTQPSISALRVRIQKRFDPPSGPRVVAHTRSLPGAISTLP